MTTLGAGDIHDSEKQQTNMIFLDTDENTMEWCDRLWGRALFSVEILLRKQPAVYIWRAERPRKRGWQGQEPGAGPCQHIGEASHSGAARAHEHREVGSRGGQSNESFWKVTL